MQQILSFIWTLLINLNAGAFNVPVVPVRDITSTEHAFSITQQETHDETILKAAQQWRLDPFLLKGLLIAESGLRPEIINKKSGAAGIGQFTASGRRGIANIRKQRGNSDGFSYADALDPKKAIPATAELLAYFHRVCKNTGRALMAYNSGKCRGAPSFVFAVTKHANRLRTASGLPPETYPIRAPKLQLAKKSPDNT